MITKAEFEHHLYKLLGFKTYEEYESYVISIDFQQFKLTENKLYVDFYSDEKYIKIMNILYKYRNDSYTKNKYDEMRKTHLSKNPFEYLRTIGLESNEINKLIELFKDAHKDIMHINDDDFYKFIARSVEPLQFGWETSLSEYKTVMYERILNTINNIKKIVDKKLEVKESNNIFFFST